MAVSRDENNRRRRERYAKNKHEMRVKAKIYRDNNKEQTRETWNRVMFSGKKNEVLERDNWECQKCGMSQEQSILLFGRVLSIHHIDDKGVNASPGEKNNDIDNLITMCMRCHKIFHSNETMKKRWGDLIKQDDSIWKYPKIRYLVEDEIKKGFGVQESKRIVTKNTGMSFTLIDHRYYDKKRRTLNQRSKQYE